MGQIDWGRTLLMILVFALIGPFIGFLVALGWSYWQIPADEPRLRALILLSGFFTIILAYVMGLPAALLTGTVAALASPFIRSGLLWVLAVVVSGALITRLLHPWFSPNTGTLIVVASGTLASLCCALMLATLRPRPVRTDEQSSSPA